MQYFASAKSLEHYLINLKCSKKTFNQSVALFNPLFQNDPFRVAEPELSICISNKKIHPVFRFLILDRTGYLSNSTKALLKRLIFYIDLIKTKIKNPKAIQVFRALHSITSTPMDIYFGADIENEKTVYGFWIILGGLSRYGQLFYNPKRDKAVINAMNSVLPFKIPSYQRPVLNLGFDISDDTIFYKIYYLYNPKKDNNHEEVLASLPLLEKLHDFNKWCFISEQFDEKNRFIKRKLFIEFLEPLLFNSQKTNTLLNIISEMYIDQNASDLKDVFKNVYGRLSIISVEKDNTIKIYFRI